MKTRPTLELSRLLPWLLAGVVCCAGLAATLMYERNLYEQGRKHHEIAFQAAADRVAANIAAKINTYRMSMLGVKGFFRGSERVHYQEFHEYFSSLAVSENLKGIQGIAFVVPVKRQNLEQHIAEMNKELPGGYSVKSTSSLDTLAPIIFIEPYAGVNLDAVGFDIFSNPVAREAAEKARDTGDVVITSPLSLVQDGDSNQTSSFVMYLPVYHVNMPVDTVAQRRAALIGWVDVPFRMTDLMLQLKDEIDPGVDIEIRDLKSPETQQLLYHSDNTSQLDRARAGEFQSQKVIDVGGRSWTLLFNSTPEFRAGFEGRDYQSLLIFTGLSLSVLFGLLVFFIAQRWNSSERKAARLSHLYHALSEVNQAIVRMETEEGLFPLVCQMAVRFGGMKMAWIAKFDLENNRMIPVAHYGGRIEYINEMVQIHNQAALDGQLITDIIGENKPAIVSDYLADQRTLPWHKTAKKFGWKSAAGFPIQRGGKPYAVLNVYHVKAGAFDSDAINLLREMSGDISFALDNFDRESQRRTFEHALVESESRLSTIMENVGACIYLKDREGCYTYVNQQAVDVLGLPREAIIGHNSEKLVDAATNAKIKDAERRVFEKGEIVEAEEIQTLQTTGVTKTFWSVKIPLRDNSGKVYALCGISTDISDKRAREEQIQFLSSYDSVTGLPNRELLREKTSIALTRAKAMGESVSLLCIDLDRFKFINESLGHSVGDLLLKKLSQRLTRQLHLNATLSRFGGDEFFLLLPGVDGEESLQIAKQLLALISEPFDHDGRQFVITASIGIAVFPTHGRSFEQLTQSVDAALAEAKQSGRNNCKIFSQEMRTQADERLLVENELRGALQKQQLVIYYQPQVDMQTGDIIGLEALIRWQHPELGLIPPNKFIPLAEESGLIIDIGNWVIDSVAKQLADWRDNYFQPLSVAVNLSVIQLYRDNFCQTVETVLEKYNLTHSMLEFELTERIAIEHSSRTITTLGQLQAMGVTLSIDDFGTGYSSLSYLKRYPVHKLKIDKSFVDGLGWDREDQAIVIAIIGIARGLGFKTVAEGVETKEQLEFLQRQGCDAYQGYYFSRPIPAEEVVNLLWRESTEK